MKIKVLFASGCILTGILISSCKKDLKTDDTVDDLSVESCEGCHTNKEYLKKVYTPDTAAPVRGCGGDAPHYEPYDRVYMGDEGYEDFKTSKHYTLGCTGCHNGVDKTKDKEKAHSDDFISHPSVMYKEKCGSCHLTITVMFKTSLHQGTGQKRKVTIRSGLRGPEEFELLPTHQKEGYNNTCATCHGTCGNCHIMRPPIAGGGLSNGHKFNKTPDMLDVCVACHVARGGHAYLGVSSGTEPDVHLTGASTQYTCMDCHSGDELHGNGKKVEQRYAYEELPECQNCHSGSVETINNYHKMHWEDFNCQICHSQVYNSCGQCHIHGEGAVIPSYMDFKIGLNPIPDIKTSYKFVLLCRTPAAPENWQEYGVDTYADFDSLPTYNYTSPHNILRWTERTEVETGRHCFENCHTVTIDDTIRNSELYLFEKDLLDWEKQATSKITVDGKLPTSETWQ